MLFSLIALMQQCLHLVWNNYRKDFLNLELYRQCPGSLAVSTNLSTRFNHASCLHQAVLKCIQYINLVLILAVFRSIIFNRMPIGIHL